MQRLFVCFLLVASSVDAQIELDDGKLTLYGDLRFRYESEWDSLRENGSFRDDRDRLRVRARIGLNWRPSDIVTLGFRLRTGKRTSQQPPHLTVYDLDENDTGPKEVAFDRLFVNFGGGTTHAWLGRNSDPFWKQNELFWDDDASLTGGTLRHEWQRDRSELGLTGGFYLLPDGMESFAGNLTAGQLVYVHRGEKVGTTLASGLFVISGTDDVEHLRRGNGARDYTIWTSNAQARFHRFTVGLDFMYNLKSYSAADADPVTAENHDQKIGFVASLAFGQARDRWDWLAAYYYAYIETFAVNASFAQDDWMRWGSEGQTDASNFKGHELRFALSLLRNMSVVARLYLVDAITSVQDAKRFRVDLDYGF